MRAEMKPVSVPSVNFESKFGGASIQKQSCWASAQRRSGWCQDGGDGLTQCRGKSTRGLKKIQNFVSGLDLYILVFVPFGVTYEKIGTIQRRLAWPLHKDDTLSRSGRSTDLNIYFYLQGFA